MTGLTLRVGREASPPSGRWRVEVDLEPSERDSFAPLQVSAWTPGQPGHPRARRVLITGTVEQIDALYRAVQLARLRVRGLAESEGTRR